MNTPAVTRPGDRVSLKTKLIFGASGMNTVLFGHLPKNLVNPVFVVIFGISPGIVSLAMMVFRLYDAMIDPLMGWISDNTRTRWGRRRPYIFVGSVLTGLSLPVMWLVSPEWSQSMQIAWLIGAGILLYTSSTIFGMAFQSLLLELTPDYNERTSVSSFVAFFQKIAVVVVGWAWFITQMPIFNNPVTGLQDVRRGAIGLSIICGVAIIGLGVAAAVFVKERFYEAASKQAKVSLRSNFKFTFSNVAFVRLSIVTVFFATAVYLSSGMGFFLRLFYVTKGDEVLAAKIGGIEGTLTMILGIASIPVFAWLSRRIGKTWTLMGAMGLTLVAMLSKWWTYDPDHPWLSMTNNIILAPSITGIWQIIPSMSGDIVDEDELRTGERREGAFASIYSWIVKASFTLGLFLAGPLVELCGLEISKRADQTAQTILAMRLTDAFIPALLLMAAMAILYRYPLSPARVAEIRGELERRRGAL